MSSNASLEQSARTHPVVATPIAAQADHAAYAIPNFANHSQPASQGPGDNSTSHGSATHPLAHGYSHTQLPQSEAHIHPELRSSNEPPATIPVYTPVPNMIPPGSGAPHPNQAVAMSPAIVSPTMGSADMGDTADGRKAKRELSQSKRAAQNRAAQRAFRQRKEGYIKKLEQQVRDCGELETNVKTLQTENYALRDYVHRLQSRLLNAEGEYPQPPPGINLAHPNHQGHPQHALPEAPQAAPPPAPSANPLEVAAQAVAGLNRSEHLADRDPYAPIRTDDDTRTAEEITRQLQADGGPDGLPAAPM
ncbi:putative transcription factor kapC [Chaetomidium leptoderma]|uniref:Putative transcription factor kapC n=1 Tax=Chaetomidium leptoderma TaxID=669021 RepID=A0AAN6ZXM6_9PEZI|nr:putative transcription factor kapC [Chaetomidium leptoderma]